ncbi:MAG: hypothetical protein E7H34_07890 [Bifidobacterium pseudocatenulatum]|nr:hypothetical protein [Bifidobacterium pseudocatenulatum]
MTSRPESDQQFTKTLQDDLLIIDTPALQPAYGMRPPFAHSMRLYCAQ